METRRPAPWYLADGFESSLKDEERIMSDCSTGQHVLPSSWRPVDLLLVFFSIRSGGNGSEITAFTPLPMTNVDSTKDPAPEAIGENTNKRNHRVQKWLAN
jgi:hypothetical protein